MFLWLLCILSFMYTSRFHQLLLIIVCTCYSLCLEHSATYSLASSSSYLGCSPKDASPARPLPDCPIRVNTSVSPAGHSLFHPLLHFWHLPCLFISLIIVHLPSLGMKTLRTRYYLVLRVYYNQYNLWKWKVLVAQLCVTLWDPMDCNLPGSSVHGILQARILEWVAMPSSRGSSWPRDWTQVCCIAGGVFTVWATREAQFSLYNQ